LHPEKQKSGIDRKVQGKHHRIEKEVLCPRQQIDTSRQQKKAYKQPDISILFCITHGGFSFPVES